MLSPELSILSLGIEQKTDMLIIVVHYFVFFLAIAQKLYLVNDTVPGNHLLAVLIASLITLLFHYLGRFFYPRIES